MRIDPEKVKQIFKRRKMTLDRALKRARVSKTAFYSLARKESVLPKSLHALAKAHGLQPSAFLTETSAAERKVRRVYRELETILKRHPEADRANVLHTLLLLQEKPIDRLRRSLTRGQNLNSH